MCVGVALALAVRWYGIRVMGWCVHARFDNAAVICMYSGWMYAVQAGDLFVVCVCGRGWRVVDGVTEFGVRSPEQRVIEGVQRVGSAEKVLR